MNMIYYITISKSTRKYFINKSSHPEKSVRHHFSRAENPNREDYNSEFYTAIRREGPWNFDISFSLEMPSYATSRAHYMPAPEGLTVEQMRGNYIIEKPVKSQKTKGKNK